MIPPEYGRYALLATNPRRLAAVAGAGTIIGMLSTRLDHWLRLGSGLGVLLLVAAQERVLPRWASEPAQPAHPVQQIPFENDLPGGEPPPSEHSNDLGFPQIMPDCTVPRAAAGGLHAAWRMTLGDRAGVVVSGPRDGYSGCAALEAVTAASWRALQVAIVWQAPTAPVQGPIRDPAILRTITRTGPPAEVHRTA
ncbi:MAG: hypothetical protein IPM18_14195 [Phycisphaerales bacterium]|nr:hypothetical protein [Phycisphaerales bacterium]